MAKKKKTTQKEEQLSLGLKSPLVNYLIKLRDQTLDSLNLFELMRYTRDALVWIFNTVSFVNLTFQAAFVYLNINVLPKELPVLNFYLLDSQKLLDRNYLYAFPITSFLIFFISYMTSYRRFNNDRELVRVMLLISAITTTFLTISILRITVNYL